MKRPLWEARVVHIDGLSAGRKKTHARRTCVCDAESPRSIAFTAIMRKGESDPWGCAAVASGSATATTTILQNAAPYLLRLAVNALQHPSPRRSSEDPDRGTNPKAKTNSNPHPNQRRTKTRLLFLSACFVFSAIATVRNFPHAHSLSWNSNANRRRAGCSIRSVQASSFPSSPLFATSSTPPGASRSSSYRNNHNNPQYKRLNTRNKNAKKASASSTSPPADSRWQRAVRIETRTQIALDNLKQRSNINRTVSKKTIGQSGHREQNGDMSSSETGPTEQLVSSTGKNTVIIRRRNSGVYSSVPPDSNLVRPSGSLPPPIYQNSPSPVSFPDIRECNFALAAFGDGGDLLRALRLYFKMRKATQMALSATSDAERKAKPETTIIVPTPTLVTYSTLMSRAVSLGKPQVALRLWKIMRNQADFFSYVSQGTASSAANSSTNNNASIKASDLQNLIVPDVKAANILMNTYAKLGDLDAAEDLMAQMQTAPVLQQETTTANGNIHRRNNSNTKGASSSPHEVVFGGGIDVPYLTPNLVTYNTLLDACQKTGELEKALHWKSVLEGESKRRGRGNDRTNITYRIDQALSIRLRPDVRTYTSLIGTVARKSSSNRQHYGTHDPSLAFSLLTEMKTKHKIAPSPLTYSALIDVCGRCRRSDLALKALRLMLRDEQMQKRMKRLAERNLSNVSGNNNSNNKHDRPGPAPEVRMDQQTVGAWTAAINACGKTGRIDTALKLFFVSMPRFNVQPNVITCSCLLDSLLKQGRTAESLDVLRYMKSSNLQPSEYMYTSLMTYASRLAGLEQQGQSHRTKHHYSSSRKRADPILNAQRVASLKQEEEEDIDIATNRPWPSLSDSNNPNQNDSASEEKDRDTKNSGSKSEGEDDTKAVDIYSELMSTLIATTRTNQKMPKPNKSKTSPNAAVAASNELYQVTLVFREMQASGVVPDLGSYNTLLRSCANSGDIDRAQEILKEIQDSAVDLEPTDRTWRAIVRAAGKAKRSDMVLKTWKSAVADMGNHSERDPKDGSFEATRWKAFREASLSATSTASNTSKRRKNNLSVQTFRTFLTALLVCAWDLRESDRYTSIELYRIVIKCYNALRSCSSSPKESSSTVSTNPPTSYMGMHLLDFNAAMQNQQIMASILQAVVNLESLLEEDDEWKGKLKTLGVSIAKTSCLSETFRSPTSKQSPRSGSLPLSFFDKKALNAVRSWC